MGGPGTDNGQNPPVEAVVAMFRSGSVGGVKGGPLADGNR